MSEAELLNAAVVQNDRRSKPRKAPSFGSRHGQKLAMGLTKQELIEKYRYMVRTVAIKLSRDLPASVELDDLVSMGFIGLMDAAEKFDPARGVKFESYASFRVRGAMIDELRREDWIPRSARDRLNELLDAKNAVEARLGSHASDADVSRHMDIPLEKFHQLLSNLGSRNLVNIDDLPAGSEPEDQPKKDPFHEAVRAEVKAVVLRMLSRLGEQERMVLDFYYYRGLTLKEIGIIFAVTESRVSQIHSRAVAHLRAHIRSDKTPAESLFIALIDE